MEPFIYDKHILAYSISMTEQDCEQIYQNYINRFYRGEDIDDIIGDWVGECVEFSDEYNLAIDDLFEEARGMCAAYFMKWVRETGVSLDEETNDE